jgi:hypothetical protein
MTDQTPGTHPNKNDDPVSTPFVRTIATPNASDARRFATHSVERSKTGRGTLIAILVIPPVLVALIVLAYATFFVAKTNSEGERKTERRGDNTSQFHRE